MENPSSDIPDWDWEVIPNSEKHPNSFPSSPSFDGGVIRADYFSIDCTAANNAAATTEGSSNGGDDVESDNPSWVDPSCSSVVVGNRGGVKFDSDSDSSGRGLSCLIQPHSDCGGDHFPKSSEIVENIGGDGLEVNSATGYCNSEGNEEVGVDDQLSRSRIEDEEGKEDENKENESKVLVWWKGPFEVLKYCVLKVRPVWSLSMVAAALMGIVLLRRRYLYKTKRKGQGLPLNVTADDKKVSQFMSRAARLNEAFSVVKRVPIIRPVLSAPGIASWQMVSLR